MNASLTLRCAALAAPFLLVLAGAARPAEAQALRPVRIAAYGAVASTGAAHAAAPDASRRPVPAGTLAGTLDASFGAGGVALFPAVEANAVAFQPDGKIVATGSTLGGDAYVARFHPDGTPDQSFGTGGVATVDLGGAEDYFIDLDVLPSGAVVAVGTRFAGSEGQGAVVARFLPNGSLDPSFGDGGLVVEPMTPDTPDAFWAVGTTPDGRIVAGGMEGDIYSPPATCYAVRYLPDGSRDPSYGTGGLSTVAPPGRDHAACLDGTLLPDGRFILGTMVWDAAAGDYEWAAMRLRADGMLDPAFGGDGIAFAEGLHAYTQAVEASPDGAVTLAGYDAGFTFTLARFTPQGALDPSFGTGGIARLPQLGPGAAAGVALQSDGKVLFTGNGPAPGGAIAAFVARVLPDGTPDGSFGAGGITYFDPGLPNESFDIGWKLGLDARGRIVVAGSADYGAPSHAGFLARFTNDQAVVVTAAPVDPPVVIGPGGGSFRFHVTLTNTTGQPQTVQAWSAVTGPAAREPVLGPRTVTLPPGATVTRTVTQRVPGRAPAGTYTYHVRLGTFPDGVAASAAFAFTKQAAGIEAPAASGADDWAVDGWDEAPSASAALPEGFALSEPRPNPFRDRAQLTLEVAEGQHVTAAAYDALGRRVAVLFDGTAEAGAPVPLTLDAGALPSGTYVVRVAGERFAATRRVTLLK